jgi:antitoxin (DNA-binding transcriptional repressor) of toxin-antitoxin stability system
VEETKGESIVVPDHGEPVIEIRPYRKKSNKPKQTISNDGSNDGELLVSLITAWKTALLVA